MVTVALAGNPKHTFILLMITYNGKCWRHNVSSKSVDVEGWRPVVFKAIDKIASYERMNRIDLRVELSQNIFDQLYKLRPEKPKPMKRIKSPRVRKMDKVVHKIQEPVEALVTHTPLPMASIYRRRSLFWEWVRKMLRL